MSQARENGHSLGGFGKYALEGNLPPVYRLLADLGITEIVKITETQMDGHYTSATWIGTRIDSVKEISERSISEVRGTGSLEIVDGDKRTEFFIQGGNIVREESSEGRRKTGVLAEGQARMDI